MSDAAFAVVLAALLPAIAIPAGAVMFACAESFVALSQIPGIVRGVAVVRKAVMPYRLPHANATRGGDIQGPINLESARMNLESV